MGSGNSEDFGTMTKDINQRYAFWFIQSLSQNYRSEKQLLISEAVKSNKKCVLDKTENSLLDGCHSMLQLCPEVVRIVLPCKKYFL